MLAPNATEKIVNITITDSLLGTYRPGFYENIAPRLSKWSQIVGANHGCEAATITLTGTKLYLDSWMQGLGRHVEVKDHLHQVIWEGFVNQITINYGQYFIVVGPLLALGNRVKVLYTRIVDATVVPPTLGDQVETLYTNDTVSQDRYGIHERIMSAGNLTDATTPSASDQATFVRDAFLQVLKDPQTSYSYQIGDAEDINVVLDCFGYWAMLDKFTYASDTAGYIQFNDKVKNVVNYDPNNLFVVNDDNIRGNLALAVASDRNRTATIIIDEIANFGDASGNRWLWGVSPGRIFYYLPIDASYTYYLRDGIVLDLSNHAVYPWQVKAGKWAFIMNTNETPIGNVVDRNSPYTMFIEQVEYESPFKAVLTGSRLNSFSQFLAHYGLGVT